MGVIAGKWMCPKCNVDVGGSMGELKNHVKRMHAETRVATAA